jgi:CheY-like chemotaxis protein
MNVLLIDDDPDIRQIGHLSLQVVGGFDVVVVASGAAGVAYAQENTPDMVLLDMMMPGMDGIATLAELRRIPTMLEVPVVFFTAKVQRTEKERLMTLGAAGVIAKPFDPMTLAQDLKKLLNRP